jgi:hypothetical protein
MDAVRAADWLNHLLVQDPEAVSALLGVAIDVDPKVEDAIANEDGALTFLSALNSMLKPDGTLVCAHYTDEGTLIRFGTIALNDVRFTES